MRNLATAIVLAAYRERLCEYDSGRAGSHLDDPLVQEGIRLLMGLPSRPVRPVGIEAVLQDSLGW